MSRLQTLPQDILFHILRAFVQSQQSNIVFPECRRDETTPLQENATRQIKIHYPYSGVTKRYGRNVHAKSHWELVRVWLALNTTCHIMRLIGTEVWYDIVQYAMHSSLPQRLQAPQRGSTQLSSRLDLARIRNLILVDYYASSPSKLLALPRCLNFFSRLRNCTLVFNAECVREDIASVLRFPRAYRTLERAIENPSTKKDRDQDGFETIPELQYLLHAIGVDVNIHINVAVHAEFDGKRIDPIETMRRLRYNMFPMLRIKAGALKRQATNANKDS